MSVAEKVCRFLPKLMQHQHIVLVVHSTTAHKCLIVRLVQQLSEHEDYLIIVRQMAKLHSCVRYQRIRKRSFNGRFPGEPEFSSCALITFLHLFLTCASWWNRLTFCTSLLTMSNQVGK